MGTSQINPGPGNQSPLVPPWADEQPEQPLPDPEPQRYNQFRKYLGKFVRSKDTTDLRKALQYYASKATGGSNTAVRRMSTVSRAGAILYGVLIGSQAGTVVPENIIDLGELIGLSCENAITQIVQAVTPINGDSDKIRAAMNHALIDALDGIGEFDPNVITDEVIVNTMIAYLAESIFLQIVQDSGKAWTKAETPRQIVDAEGSLRELITVEVDKHMESALRTNTRTFTSNQIFELQQKAIRSTWIQWENYQ